MDIKSHQEVTPISLLPALLISKVVPYHGRQERPLPIVICPSWCRIEHSSICIWLGK
jgi:hypothetical protein